MESRKVCERLSFQTGRAKPSLVRGASLTACWLDELIPAILVELALQSIANTFRFADVDGRFTALGLVTSEEIYTRLLRLLTFFFTSKDENLTKAHIRYLEGRLIEQARHAARAIVQNGQSSGARLPESDREDMEIFLEKVHQLLPVLGVEVLIPVATPAAATTERELLYCEIKGLKATGHLTPNGFVVLAGSQAVLTERPSSQKYPWPLNMRQKLKEEGILVAKPDHLVFTQDAEFSSPSAAAAVIHGSKL